jgi:hypothetical protein
MSYGIQSIPWPSTHVKSYFTSNQSKLGQTWPCESKLGQVEIELDILRKSAIIVTWKLRVAPKNDIIWSICIDYSVGVV